MKKSILKLLIIITITSLIVFSFGGCKSPDTTELEEKIEKLELEKKIEELEGELAEKEAEEASPEEEEEDVTEDTTDTEEMEEEEDGEEEPGDTDADTDTDADADKEAPTISLAIYEGPTLDGSICYSRVAATVKGNPGPTVVFSKDDSGGAWGSKKTQVNIDNPGDTYTLTATAKNSEGSATATITLDWGCAIPAPDPIVKSVDIGADASLSGHIIVNLGVFIAPTALVGDSSNNLPVNAYLSFDISSIGALNDVTIKDVNVTIPVELIKNHPEQVPGFKVIIGVCDYGHSLDYPADQTNPDSVGVKTFDALNPMANFNFSTNTLENELQKAVDTDKKWFQLKIALFDTSANDTTDHYRFTKSAVNLHIEYEVPG